MLVEQWCQRLLGYPEEVWAEFCRRNDPLGGLMTPPGYLEAYLRCSEDGWATARSVGEGSAARGGSGGPCDPEALLRARGVRVESRREDGRFLPDPGEGPFEYALFVEPDEVVVFEDSAELAQSLVDDGGLSSLLGHVCVRDVLLAHELFHVICRGDGSRPCRQPVARTRGIGFLRRQTTLSSLEEVSAMSFARELCGLGFNANALSVLMLVPERPQRAQAVMAALDRISGDLRPDWALDTSRVE